MQASNNVPSLLIYIEQGNLVSSPLILVAEDICASVKLVTGVSIQESSVKVFNMSHENYADLRRAPYTPPGYLNAGYGPCVALIENNGLTYDHINSMMIAMKEIPSKKGEKIHSLSVPHGADWVDFLTNAVGLHKGNHGRGGPSRHPRYGDKGPYGGGPSAPPANKESMIRFELLNMFFLESKGFNVLDRILGEEHSHFHYILSKTHGNVNLRVKGYPTDIAPTYNRLHISVETSTSDLLTVAVSNIEDLLKSVCQQAVDFARLQSIPVPAGLGFTQHKYHGSTTPGQWVYEEEIADSERPWMQSLMPHEIFASRIG